MLGGVRQSEQKACDANRQPYLFDGKLPSADGETSIIQAMSDELDLSEECVDSDHDQIDEEDNHPDSGQRQAGQDGRIGYEHQISAADRHLADLYA